MKLLIANRHDTYPKTISQKQSGELKRSLDRLAEILQDCPDWVLSGGLVIPLNFRAEFYRKHRDIDLGVHKDKLRDLTVAAEKDGYQLFSRKFMTHLSPSKKFEIYKKVSAGDVLRSYRYSHKKDVDNGHKNLRLMMTDVNGNIISSGDILDYFDIYLHEFVGNEMISFEEGLLSPTSWNLGKEYITISGRKIRLRNINYITRLKKRGSEPIDVFDLEKIRELKYNIRLEKKPLKARLARVIQES